MSGFPVNNRTGFSTAPAWMNPYQQWSHHQQQQADQDAKQRYMMSLLQNLYGQQNQNAAQNIYNAMSEAQAMQNLASQQYNVVGDDFNQRLRVGGMQGDIAAQQRNVNQAQRAAEQYYQQAQYGQSVSEIPSFAERGKRLLSGAY